MSIFRGFPEEGIDFLRQLGENNNKAWFEENKKRYQEKLLKPAVGFVTAVGEALRADYRNINYDTRTNGSGSLMRIYRDTRFSKDKTPYKTNISGMWWEGSGKKTQSPGFGFQLESTGMGLMGGMFHFDKEQLERFRQAVDDEKTGPELQKIVDALEADEAFELPAERYKKVPRGYDSDHPRAELLKWKGLWAHPHQRLTAEEVQSEDLVDRVITRFRQMRPLQKWLVERINN